MNKTLIALTSLGVGAGIMYVADPREGRRRRARVRDTAVHAAHAMNSTAGMTVRDVEHRASGLAARFFARIAGRPSPVDDVLVARVRSRLGRLVSHPGAIEVTAANGVVRLSGPMFESELDQLLSGIAEVTGVSRVEHRLQLHRRSEALPALQGSGPMRTSRAFRWTPTGRLLAGAAGLVLL